MEQRNLILMMQMEIWREKLSGVVVADDALCHSAMAAMILSIVGIEEVNEVQDGERMN